MATGLESMRARCSQVRSALRWPRRRGADARSGPAATPAESDPLQLSAAAPPEELCAGLVLGAAQAGASDIHVESGPAGAAVRYRIAGVLEPIMSIPPDRAPAVVDRFLALARDASGGERQDGTFRIDGERPIDVHLSALPNVHGYTLVMRVIDAEAPLQTLAALGYGGATVDVLRAVLNRRGGLVLVTGPSGSGKTRLLYAALQYLNNGTRTLVSIEDIVERRIAGVNQIAVGPRDSAVASVLRSVLRHNPDVVMVGEIRDPEVAQAVAEATYAGHLVLGSLHTTDAVSGLSRLVNLGVEPVMVAESLAAIVAQRLVRLLCRHCRVPTTPVEARALGDQHGVDPIPVRRGPGCAMCRFTAYSGRTPVVEAFVPDEPVRDLIARSPHPAAIRAMLKVRGFSTLRDGALALLADGLTSIEEVERLLPPEGAGAARPASRAKVVMHPSAGR
jgi:general secretion pathway protein E